MNCLLQKCGKGGILGGSPLFGAFHSSTGSPEFFGFMAGEQKRVDIILGIGPTILMENRCATGKAHGSKAVILGDNDIRSPDPVCDGEIHTVRTLVENQGLRTVTMEFVGSVA